jgi:hypothetical protein
MPPINDQSSDATELPTQAECTQWQSLAKRNSMPNTSPTRLAPLQSCADSLGQGVPSPHRNQPDYASLPIPKGVSVARPLAHGAKLATWAKQPRVHESCRRRSWRSSNTIQRREASSMMAWLPTARPAGTLLMFSQWSRREGVIPNID